MKKALSAAALLAASTTLAQAGGIERVVNDYGMLFQPGDQLSFGASIVNPNISGDYAAGLGGGSTGEMAKSYVATSFGYKNDLSDKLALGLYFNDAYGADSAYSQGFYTGLTAQWNSKQTAAMLRYRIGERFSVYGGARYVESDANIVIPDQMIRAATASEIAGGIAALTGAGVPVTDPRVVGLQTQLAAVGAAPVGAFTYTAQGDRRGDWGAVLGAAYEIPDIALRVGLTWESAITHEFDTSEALPFFGLNGNTSTEVEMPQSIALDFQTGVAPGTLVFGQVKWTEWSAWEVRTPGYAAITGDEVTGFDDDVMTYKLGVGRQFNDAVSGFAQVTYEPGNGGVASRLSPTDGRISLGVGGQITGEMGKMRFGLEYVKLGDATDASGTEFTGNSAVGAGISFTMNF